VLLQVLTDFPERLQPGCRVFLGESHKPSVVDGSRPHNRGMLVTLRGIDTLEAAGKLRNQGLYVTTSDRPRLPAGVYYHHELLGAVVVDERQDAIGTLAEILITGANDVYVVRDAAGHEILLPVIESVILDVDAAQRVITARVPDGLQGEPGA
jgi:16S rRNA processing protein RimM